MSEQHQVNNRGPYVFVVYDGRAWSDEDEATVLEAINQYVNYERVWKYFTKHYGKTDSCLFAYEDRDGQLVNGVHILDKDDLTDL